MAAPVVALSKLHPPEPPPAEVPRSALVERVVTSGNVRLVLLCAPAGFGKTTAMQQLRRRYADDGAETAWLSLDAADNDGSRFLTSLGAALAAVCDGPGWPDAGDPLTALAGHSGRFALFLDDFEALQAAAVLALVRSVIERLPRGGLVVIGSRVMPELGIGRLRAHGQLLELDVEMLRFSRKETENYLRLRGQAQLPPEAVGQLHGKSEGWIVALWLASAALERPGVRAEDFIAQFSGSNRAIAEYLAGDVLAQQTPDVRAFLLRTSVLRSFDASVCKALLPRLDIEAILHRLDSENLFLVSEGGEATYRYHHLVADFLRTRLMREHPNEVPRLHLAASGWYEAQGRPVPAIDHAIEGGDYPHALALLARDAQRFLEEGRMRLLARWFGMMPWEDVARIPLLQAVSVWAALFTQGPGPAAALLERSSLGISVDPAVAAHVNAQAPMLLALQDRYEEAQAIGARSIPLLPTGNAFADSVLCNAMAHVYMVVGEQRKAQDLIDHARQSKGAFNRMYAESVEGMLDLQGGRLRAATARFRVAVSATSAASHNYTSGNAWAGILYSLVLYEVNDLDAAEPLIDVYLPLACDVGLPGHVIAGHMVRTRIAFSRGLVAKAFETLTALEYLGHHRQLPRLVATAKLERARLLLLQGNAQASCEELDRADDPQLWARVRQQRLPANESDFLALARIRWDLHFGDPRAALPVLQTELEEAVQLGRERRAMKLRMLRSLALQLSGDPAAAVEDIAAVVKQASHEGFVRLIADEGPAIGRLVQHFHTVLQEMPARRSDPLLMDYLQRLLAAFGPLPPEEGPVPPGEALMEPLTRKELQVLQLASEGYSNAAMCEKLGLSDSTVRTHLRNISTKLNAKSRADAVAIGRRLGVIR
jgi:LuxR family maltose regulon positive regulatory protein